MPRFSTAANSPGTRSKEIERLHRRKPETSASQERRTGIHWREGFLGEGTVVEDGAMIKRPGPSSAKTVRFASNAYIRENVINRRRLCHRQFKRTEKLAVVQQVPTRRTSITSATPFRYKAHLGAGVKVSKLQDCSPAHRGSVERRAVRYRTAQIRRVSSATAWKSAANAVLNPGSIIGRGAVIYPNVFWRGILPDNVIAKNKAEIKVSVKRPRES